MSIRTALRSAFAILAILASSGAAHAQLFRAYVASDGNDANPCTLPAPCRLLPAALAAVADGGEIWMLDSANYNTAPVNVAKSVTILAIPGALGSVVATSGNAININAPGITVALRNLMIVPLPGAGGIDGISVTNGSRLRVEGCVISGLSAGRGIHLNAPIKAQVVDTIVRDNSYGIYMDNGASASISRTLVSGSTNVGIWAAVAVPSTVTAYISDTILDQNNYGVVASGSAGGRLARVYVTRSTASGNSFAGFQAYSGGVPGDSILELSASVAAGNQYGLINEDGTFHSAGNNRVTGNTIGNTLGTITVTSSN